MLGNLEANEKRHGCLRNQQFAIKVSLVITFVKLKNKHHWNRALPSLGQKLPLQFFLYCYCYCRFTGGDNEVIPKQRMVATCSVTLFSFGKLFLQVWDCWVGFWWVGVSQVLRVWVSYVWWGGGMVHAWEHCMGWEQEDLMYGRLFTYLEAQCWFNINSRLKYTSH